MATRLMNLFRGLPGTDHACRSAAPGPRPGWRRLATVLLSGLLGLAPAGLASAADPAEGASAARDQATANRVVRLLIETQGAGTCFGIVSTARLEPQVFQVGKPDRVVVDAPGISFHLSRPARPGGFVTGFRYGKLDSGQARIVIDVAAGVRIGKLVRRRRGDGLHQLSIRLARDGAAVLKRPCRIGPGARRTASQARGKTAAEGKRAVPAKPVVVIDPGHGGIDPGAVVNKVYLEKIIALAVGRRLAKRLRGAGRYEVVMTRNEDAFISLDDRVERAREKKADLFISLHADSIEDSAKAKLAQGASVYVLSHRASDAEAKRVAEKENAADLLAGILPVKDTAEDVRGILVDLLKRETERESARFQKLLVSKMRERVPLSGNPARAAAFRVLKQTETPAALVELGYMTNAGDLQRMRRKDWQERMVGAVAAAIGQFFDEK